ncbi:MAG TPA: AAA family ATPase [Polyangiaceae bacterium]|nr:AAA family ATPase [Polyangiaceae bacterium]
MAEQEITTLTLERYSPEARALIVATQALADASRHAEVTPLHLLSQCLTGELAIQEVFRRAAISFTDLQSAVEGALARQPVARERATLSALLLDLMRRAEREAQRTPQGVVHVEHLLNALAQEVRGAAGEILGAFQIGPGSLRPHLAGLRSTTEVPVPADKGQHPVLGLYTSSLVARARAGQFGPVLGRDAELRRLLTILERREKHHPLLVGENGVGKATIVRGLAQRVARKDVPLGSRELDLLELDVGALVAGTRLRGELEGRARKLIDALTEHPGAVLVVLGFDQLYAAASPLGGLGDLLRSALDRSAFRLIGTTTPEGERRIVERDPFLYQHLTRQPVLEPSLGVAAEMVRGAAGVYERHHRVQISEDAIQTAVNLAKRYVPDRFLPDSAFDLLDEAAAAKRVEVDGEPQLDAPVRRFESLQAQLAALVGADDDATRRARQALEREAAELEPLVAQRRKAIDSRRSARALLTALRSELNEQRAAHKAAQRRGDLARAGEAEHVGIPELESRLARAEAAAKQLGIDTGPPVLLSTDIAQTLALRTGVPVAKMLEAETEKLSQIESRLSRRVVGQDLALTKVARAVRRGRMGLRDARRPIGSFLFLGPSGVGKTELAKALAEFLFDDEQALTRLDMSEYMERHMAQRLLGAPPGYADSEQGGLLTEAVRQRPYSVLLFDEVEKAHQDVFNLLLQVLDDGRLTDGRGRLADFTNTVVILTSNIGSRLALGAGEPAPPGDGTEELPEELRRELGNFFRPEFLNRIGDVVLFGALSREHLRKIVDIQLDKVRKLLAPRGLGLEVSEAAKARLVELGYEPGFGARPLERTIVRRVQDPIAEGLMAGTFQSGQTLELELAGDLLELRAR